jgi:UDP-N-acetylmuramoylalanine--D-glutamate ligase
MVPADLAGKTVAIVGTGREGVSVSRMLRGMGGVELRAIIDAEGGPGSAWDLAIGGDVPVHVFDGDVDILEGIEVAVLSPGVAPHRPLFQSLMARGVVFTSGTDLFVNRWGPRMVGVTGSKGKSTTSALIAHILSAHHPSVSWGGNVGVPLWDVEPADVIVAELSSYQCSSLTASPRVAVVTSLFEEHLDWHGSADQYFADKLNLVSHHPEHVILGGHSSLLVNQMSARYPGLDATVVGIDSAWSVSDDGPSPQITDRGEAVVACADLPVIGHHNWWNVATALEAASRVVELDRDTVVAAVTSFTPLPHRLEPIDDPSGIRFINDSLATNPSAAAKALEALRAERVIVLIGGADRGVDRSPLRDEIIAHPPAAVIGLPASGASHIDDILAWCREAGVAAPQCHVVSSMDEAIAQARAIAQPGDVVLLSPGAPSFGQYRDYEHRAEDFRRAISESRA